jgi:hypothetical protein
LAVERQRRAEEVDGKTWLDKEKNVVVAVWSGVVLFQGQPGAAIYLGQQQRHMTWGRAEVR